MADLPDVRSPLLPQRPPPPRQLYDRPHAYGVARDLERMKEGFVPPPRTPRIQPRSPRGGPWASFRRWAATRERGPGALWHRLRCRMGRHEMRGGHQMQLGSSFVFVERRCVWCDARPAL
ncbi:MAG: hypothetical protein M3203_01640 [Actinomycetota bacterium]|nr:hypothetical protein [Actinomycetota bacterium]